MFFKSLDKKECCACTVCQHICPTKSISFSDDEEGFKYPQIDHSTCINCGLCERSCPVEHPLYDNNSNPIVYAAKLYNTKELVKSSSGGLFYSIAKAVLSKRGTVYGAAFDENLKLKHCGIENLDDLQPLRGSKYIQSNLGDIFLDVKDQLTSDRWVYFVGTPCQVAGLKSFLKKDYPKLITSDLVCHGVPSQKLFDAHIDYLENKYKRKVLKYQFRNNKNWGGCEIVDLATPKGKSKRLTLPSYELSPYLYSFMYAMTYRHSCYDCKFARIPRQGDITLADFWGANVYFPKMNTNKGVSLVLVNNRKGEIIWNEIADQLENHVSRIEDAAKFNGNQIQRTEKSIYRDDIYKQIENEGYSTIANTVFRSPRYIKVKISNVIIYTPGLNIIHKFYRILKKIFISFKSYFSLHHGNYPK